MSTHLKANAYKRKFTKEIVEPETKAYLDDLNQAIKEEREIHGKKPLKAKKKKQHKWKNSHSIKQSN